MEQMTLGILIGVVALAAIGGLAWLIVVIHSIVKAAGQVIAELERTREAFSKSANVSAALTALVEVNRQLITSVEAMAGAVHVFTGLVLPARQEPDEDEPSPEAPWNAPVTPRGPVWRPPVPPWPEEMPTEVEAGALSQTDEELSEIELQREAQERGEPTVSDILALRKDEDIREDV